MPNLSAQNGSSWCTSIMFSLTNAVSNRRGWSLLSKATAPSLHALSEVTCRPTLYHRENDPMIWVLSNGSEREHQGEEQGRGGVLPGSRGKGNTVAGRRRKSYRKMEKHRLKRCVMHIAPVIDNPNYFVKIHMAAHQPARTASLQLLGSRANYPNAKSKCRRTLRQNYCELFSFNKISKLMKKFTLASHVLIIACVFAINNQN